MAIRGEQLSEQQKARIKHYSSVTGKKFILGRKIIRNGKTIVADFYSLGPDRTDGELISYIFLR